MLGKLNSPEKWCKFELANYEGGVESMCLMGALNKACTGSPFNWIIFYGGDDHDVAASLVREMDRLAKEKGYGGHLVRLSEATVYFNNAPETEYEDVRLFLKEVLERVA